MNKQTNWKNEKDRDRCQNNGKLTFRPQLLNKRIFIQITELIQLISDGITTSV